MTALSLVVLMYAVGVSAALLYAYRRRSQDDAIGRALTAFEAEEHPVAERVQVMKAIAEIRNNDIRWFERALSTMGVVALISATVAAAVQTIRFAVEEQETKRLEQRALESEGRIGSAEALISAMARVLLGRASQAALMNEDEKRILRYRMDRLAGVDEPDQPAVDELIAIAITLHDYSRSVSLIERRPELLREDRAADQVSLAEYYFLVGSQAQARQMSERAWVRRAQLPRPVAMRLLTMRSLLSLDSAANVVADAARLLGVSLPEAEIAIDADVDAFKAGAKRLRADR